MMMHIYIYIEREKKLIHKSFSTVFLLYICILINMYLHWFVLTFIYIMMYSIEIIYLDITYKRYKQ